MDAQTLAAQALLDDFEGMLANRDEVELAALGEQLWKYRRRLPDLIVERFHAGRVKYPAVTFELLGNMAGGRTPTFLRRIAADPAVEDIVRWGARRRSGWAERGQVKARREFLASLADPAGTLLVALSQADAAPLANGEVLQEVLAYLKVMLPDQRQAFVQQALAQSTPTLPWLLRCLVHMDADPDLQLACISALLSLGDAGAVGALERVVARPAAA
jgi:hypothetical protein